MFGFGGKSKLSERVTDLEVHMKVYKDKTVELAAACIESKALIDRGNEKLENVFEGVIKDMDHRSEHVEELFNTVNGELNGIKKQMLAFEGQIAKIVAAMEPRKAKPAPQEDDGKLFEKKKVVKVRKKQPEPWPDRSVPANLKWQRRADALGHDSEKAMWLDMFGGQGEKRREAARLFGVTTNLLPHRWAKLGLGWRPGEEGRTVVYSLTPGE